MELRHEGLLVSECTLPGETHDDDVYAAHPNGIRASRDRWLITYSTRGMDGWDSDRSAVYQLRRNAPDGPVIKEGMLDAGIYDWDPLGDGNLCFKQHGHPAAFGVPKGALMHGETAPHANLFVIKWRVVGLAIDPQSGRIFGDDVLDQTTQDVEWMQIQLNEAEDDVEVVAPPASMRQKGYESESGSRTEARDATWMNATFVQAVPFNDDCTEWADCNHFSPHGVAAFRYRYNPQRHLYEWVQTGPYLFESSEGRCMFEASLARWRDEWIIGARIFDQGCSQGMAWLRTDDPFAPGGTPVITDTPACNAPRCAYTCADGVLRLFTGDPTASPYGDNADPLYCWDIDPDQDFAATNRQVILDLREAGIVAGRPKLDMCKLLTPLGNSQTIIYRVAPRFPIPAGTAGDPAHAWRELDQRKDFNSGFTPEEKNSFGIYHSKLVYSRKVPSPWRFAPY